MQRRRAVAWAGSITATGCAGALALGALLGGFGFPRGSAPDGQPARPVPAPADAQAETGSPFPAHDTALLASTPRGATTRAGTTRVVLPGLSSPPATAALTPASSPETGPVSVPAPPVPAPDVRDSPEQITPWPRQWTTATMATAPHEATPEEPQNSYREEDHAGSDDLDRPTGEDDHGNGEDDHGEDDHGEDDQSDGEGDGDGSDQGDGDGSDQGDGDGG